MEETSSIALGCGFLVSFPKNRSNILDESLRIYRMHFRFDDEGRPKSTCPHDCGPSYTWMTLDNTLGGDRLELLAIGKH